MILISLIIFWSNFNKKNFNLLFLSKYLINYKNIIITNNKKPEIIFVVVADGFVSCCLLLLDGVLASLFCSLLFFASSGYLLILSLFGCRPRWKLPALEQGRRPAEHPDHVQRATAAIVQQLLFIG